jgi:acyl-coenzyme A synthetase/AMP-(fatty) acid ligase
MQGADVKTVSGEFELACRRYADRTAFFEHRGVPVSFSNFFFTAASFAENLEDNGVRAGDIVAVHVEDDIAYLALKLALLRLGAVSIEVPHADALQRPDLGVRWICCAADIYSGHKKEILVTAAWIRSPLRFIPVSGHCSIISATSGTTGLPKFRIEPETSFQVRVENLKQLLLPGAGPVMIAQNRATVLGFKSSLAALALGLPQLFYHGTVADLLQAVVGKSVCQIITPPIHFARLVEYAATTRPETPALARILVGGGEISPALALQAEELFGCEVHSMYGSTETDGIASHRTNLTPFQPGTVGRAHPGYLVQIRERRGRETGEMAEGEVWVRVPTGLSVADHPSGEALFPESGWISTGDVGRFDAGDRLVITGRKTDLINVGGNKLAPSSIERRVLEIEGVSEAAAFGIPTGSGIDDIGIAVVTVDGAEPGPVETALAYAFGSLFRFQVFLVDALPTTKAGKLNRQELTRTLGRSG